jgi:nitroimidazol reductase NimA-like FMN-containing flavoprotein (pyridoxamine 5'-phosphate oxidase superfamily)
MKGLIQVLIRELAIEECEKVLAAGRLGRLACARDNQPYTVPFHFAYDGKACLYAFSTLGQKIEWMRSNPLVCVEVDEIKEQNDWTTIVIFGKYEELVDTQQFAADRSYAYDLLSRQPMWWEPAYVAGTHRRPCDCTDPIYFRIHISHMTGHRASADASNGDRKGRNKWRSSTD